MRIALLIVLLLIAGFIIGPMWSGNTGYVLISLGSWTIETSVIALVMMLVAAVILITLIYKLGMGFWRRSKAGVRWFGVRREHKSEKTYQKALGELANQNIGLALKSFEQAWTYQKRNDAAILALHTAQLLGQPEVAKKWLERSDLAQNQVEVAEFLLTQRNTTQTPERVAAEVARLLDKHPEHPELVQIAMTSYQRAHKWEELRRLLPVIERQELLSVQQLDKLIHDVYYALFMEHGRRSAEALKIFWRQLDRQQRRQGSVRLAYTKVLLVFAQNESAGKVLARGIDRQEIDISKAIEERLFVPGSNELLQYLQNQLKAKPNDGLLLHALGQLAIASEDYSLAQRALKKAVERIPSPEVYRDLAIAYDHLGDTQLALECYQKALN